MKIIFRQAVTSDIEQIISFDHIAQQEQSRVNYISQTIDAGECFTAVLDYIIVGYAVFNYNFYEQGMIDMLYINPTHRRKGIGRKFIEYFIDICKTEKLFTSTNQSNKSTQNLLEQAGFQKSGVIYNLDEDDPEIVYFKQVIS